VYVSEVRDKRCARTVSSLFPKEVVTEEADSAGFEGWIHPEEEALVRDACLKRKLEFAAGRECARRALERLGITDFPVLAAEDRAPIWPPGLVGGISHAGEYCGVAVARKEDVGGLGLDIERLKGLDRESTPLICTASELSRLGSAPDSQRKRLPYLIFSAKECVYKCLRGVTEKWLDFHDVMISPLPISRESDRAPRDFEAVLLVDAADGFERGKRLRGKYSFRDGYVFTAMVLGRRVERRA
jgi:4'-phosphopantetheinyl transferase EntD